MLSDFLSVGFCGFCGFRVVVHVSDGDSLGLAHTIDDRYEIDCDNSQSLFSRLVIDTCSETLCTGSLLNLSCDADTGFILCDDQISGTLAAAELLVIGSGERSHDVVKRVILCLSA